MRRLGWLFFGCFMGALASGACTFDASGLPGRDPELCGNGQLDPGEPCDGDLFSTTCRREGYVGGFLLCRPDCSMDNSRCITGCGECVPGSRRCLDNQIFTCTEYGDGCGMWTQEKDCSQTREWCREEGEDVSCRATCIDQCPEGQRACAADGRLEGCREVMATDIQVCRIWQTLSMCTQGCEDLPRPHCTDPCVDACREGAERCSVDRSRREICAEGYSGCLAWMNLFPHCVPGREICEEYDNDLTLCGCHLCEAGARRCSPDQTKVLLCVEDGNGCTTWSTQVDCDLLGSFARCSEADDYRCVPFGDTCSAVLPIDPSPEFKASTDHFDDFFDDSANFTDPTCGGAIPGASEAFASLRMNPAETLRARQTAANGPSVRFRLQDSSLCGGDNPCLAFADRTLVYTDFVGRTVVLSAEVDWNSSHESADVDLVIERIPNGCTDAEREPNDGFATANALSIQALEAWGFCSSLTPPNPGVSDVDCMAFTMPAPGRRIEVRAAALDGSDTCISDLLLRLYRSDGTLIATSSRPAIPPGCARIAPDEDGMAELVALAPGIYKACVSRDPGQPQADVITHLEFDPPPATPVSTGFYNCLPSGWDTSPLNAWSCDSTGRFMYASLTGTQTGVFSLRTPQVDLTGYSHAVLQFSYLFSTNNPAARLRVVYSVNNDSTEFLLAEYDQNTSGRRTLYVPADALAGIGQVRLAFQLDVPTAGTASSTRVELDDVILYVW